MCFTLTPIYQLKLRILFYLSILGLVPLQSFAQEGCPLDSLQGILAKNTQDTLRVMVLNEVAWCYSQSNRYPQSIQYAQEALKLSQKLKYKAGESTAYMRQGMAQLSTGEFQKSRSAFRHSLAIEKTLKNTYGVSRAQHALASSFSRTSKADSAILYFKLAKTGYEELSYDVLAAKVNIQIGKSYSEKGDKEAAIQYILEALNTFQDTQNTYWEAETYLSLGNLEYHAENAPQASYYYIQAHNIYQKLDKPKKLAAVYINLGLVQILEQEYDSSNQLLYQGLALYDSLGWDDSMDEVYYSISGNLKRLKRYDEARNILNKSLQLAKSQDDQSSLVNAYTTLAELLSLQKKADSAYFYYEQGLSIAQKSKLLDYEQDVLESYFKFCAQQGDFKRFDSLYNLYQDITSELQGNYQSAVNYRLQFQEEKRKNELLAQEQVVLEAKNQRQLTFIIALIMGVLLISVLTYFIYRNYNNHRKAVAAKKLIALKEKEIDTLFQEINIQSTNAMLQGQEEERNRIAKDLHDRLGGLLSMVKLNFEAVDRQIDEIKLRNVEMYQQAVKLLDNACEEVRNVAHNMESGILRNFGLIAAIEEMVKTIQTSELIDIHLTDVGFDDKRLPILMEIELNRVIQELVSNVIRHAEATQIDIQLFWKPDLINMIVEDNGKGFDPEKVKGQAGMGLRNLEQRVKSLHGELIFDSHPGRGTTALINIPFNDMN